MTIKTPDQRVRVFVSSTLNELAAERLSVRSAISKLRLIPVMFELGARPHPPRDLYRSYLEQSHIFVGIYWNNYGWVAPDMTISGLEDEYRLSEGKPRLIYVKKPAQEREPQLTRLLKEIEHSGSACYRYFTSEKELGELLENDLALLLSERFDIVEERSNNDTPRETLPIMRSSIVGREKEIRQLEDMILSTDIFLVSVTGMGGSGKTRIAIELAHRLKGKFRDGVYYVSLAPLEDHNLVAGTIAHNFGIFDNGSQPIFETLLEFLVDKQVLLLLDNFEHVVEGGALLSDIIQRCKEVKLLVTSRMPLNVSVEHIFPLQPLQVPSPQSCRSLEEAMQSESVNLFIQRARQINPLLELSGENLDAVCEICRKLDGLPLAIELAALRTRYLSPVTLLSRMGKVLDLLSHGPKDMPARQQALRASIDWSYDLLDEECKRFFYRLAVFSEGWTMESAHAVVNEVDSPGIDVMEATEKLIDLGLLRIFSHYNEENVAVEPRFAMLQTVREYAEDKLSENNEVTRARKAHAKYFLQLCEQGEPQFWTAVPDHWFNRLQRDHDNLRAAVEYMLELGMTPEAWQLFGAVGHFWIARGWATEARQWLNAIGVTLDNAEKFLQDKSIDPVYIARALNTASNLYFPATEFVQSESYALRAQEIFREMGDKKGIALSGVLAGSALISMGDLRAREIFEEAITYAKETDFNFGIVLGHAFLAEVYLKMNKVDTAMEMIHVAESACLVSDKGWQLALTMLQRGNVSLSKGDYQDAERSFRKSISAFTTCFKTLKGWAYVGLGHCCIARNDLGGARIEFNLAVECGRETGEKGIVAAGLTGLSGVMAASGEYVDAARVAGAIERYCYKLGEANWSNERMIQDRVLGILKDNLKEGELDEYLDSGLSLEEAIVLAAKGTSQLEVS